jgi:hypothetical protein
MSGVSWVKRERSRGTRTNTNYCAIFGLFIFSGDGGWTEKNKSKEEEESERQARDKAGCMRPCWTRHVEGGKDGEQALCFYTGFYIYF